MSLDIQHGDVRELFEACDLDASGFIDRHELAAVVDLDPEDLREIFEKLDTDEDGRISIDEFTENFNKFKNLASQIDKEPDKEKEGFYDEDFARKDSDLSSSERPRPNQVNFDREKISLKSKVVDG